MSLLFDFGAFFTPDSLFFSQVRDQAGGRSHQNNTRQSLGYRKGYNNRPEQALLKVDDKLEKVYEDVGEVVFFGDFDAV